MPEVTEAILNGLAAKIESLELTEIEQAILDRTLERAADNSDDTTGFVASEDELVEVKSLREAGFGGVDAVAMPGLSPFSLKLGKGAGLWG